jgi:hypothetical protein
MATAVTLHTDATPATVAAPDSIFASNDVFEAAQRHAKMLASSSFIPQAFQGNVANCLVAMEMAARMRVSPLAVMQNLDVIHGTPSLRAKFVIAIINSSGRFAHDLRFTPVEEGGGGLYAWTSAHDGTRLKGATVTMQMAREEGWIGKQGSKWKTMPELMLQYRAGTFFGRVHCPDLLLGMPVGEDDARGAPTYTARERAADPLRGNDGYRPIAGNGDPYALPAGEIVTTQQPAQPPSAAFMNEYSDESRGFGPGVPSASTPVDVSVSVPAASTSVDDAQPLLIDEPARSKRPSGAVPPAGKVSDALTPNAARGRNALAEP